MSDMMDSDGKASAPPWPMALSGIFLALFLAWGVGWLQSRDHFARQQIVIAHVAAAEDEAIRRCTADDRSAVIACVKDSVAGAYRTANDEQNLKAQQRAAMSALVTAVAAIFGIAVSIVGIYFVKRTLEATLAAVTETGNATREMERQGALAAIAQRPWVVLKPRISKVEVDGNRLTMLVCVQAENIGKSVAQNVSMWMKVVQGEHRLEAAVRDINRRLELMSGATSPLVPGDVRDHWNQGNWAIIRMTAAPHTGRAEFYIFAAVTYDVPGDPVRRITQRAFAICEGDPLDPFEERGLKCPPTPSLQVGNLGIHPAGRSQST